jgi:hypothetical protein
MGILFGALGLDDTELVFNQTRNQVLVWDAVQELAQRYNEDMMNAQRLFVDGTTEVFKERFKLPGTGRLQKAGRMGTPGTIKSGGSWDVSYPIEQWEEQFAWDDITIAKMDGKEFETHFQTILNTDADTQLYLILRRLFNNTNFTVTDDEHGALTIVPLANTDGTLYPPVIGSRTEAQEESFIPSQYASTAISDTNNPFKTIVDRLEKHYGIPSGGSNIWAFIHTDQVAAAKGLADFVEYTPRGTNPGADTATLTGMPSVPAQMRLIGRTSGAWVFEWRVIPTGYILGIHGDAPKPLMERVDLAKYNLPRGLAMVSQGERHYPFNSWFWRRRNGFGTGNRLNGCIVYLTAGSSYTIPTAYT